LILIAAVLLLAAVLWVKSYREEAPRRGGFAFDTTRAAEVTSLRVQYHRDSMLIRAAGDGAWVTQDGYPVDSARLREALGWLLRLRTREKVSEAADARSLWDYGLNPEDAKTVEWTWASGETERVLLGKTSALDYSYTYWKWKDPRRGGAVYRTPGNFAWNVSSRVHDWKERRLWPPFTAADVRALSVDWRDGAAVRHYRLERTEGAAATAEESGYLLTEPYRAPASRAVADHLFENAPQFAADDFGLELDPRWQSATVADPEITLSIILKNGTTYTLKGGEVFREYQYSRHPRLPHLLVWVFRWRYDYYKKSPEELAPGPEVPRLSF
jgi:hypothetical protein